MKVYQILNSLEKSWERDDILLKIQNGKDTVEIVNEFLAKNEMQIKELTTLLRPEAIDLSISEIASLNLSWASETFLPTAFLNCSRVLSKLVHS